MLDQYELVIILWAGLICQYLHNHDFIFRADLLECVMFRAALIATFRSKSAQGMNDLILYVYIQWIITL